MSLNSRGNTIIADNARQLGWGTCRGVTPAYLPQSAAGAKLNVRIRWKFLDRLYTVSSHCAPNTSAVYLCTSHPHTYMRRFARATRQQGIGWPGKYSRDRWCFNRGQDYCCQPNVSLLLHIVDRKLDGNVSIETARWYKL